MLKLFKGLKSKEKAEKSPAENVEILSVDDISNTVVEEADVQVSLEVAKEAVQKLSEDEQLLPTKQGFFKRLVTGLQRTRNNFTKGLDKLVYGKKEIDKELLEAIEVQLLLADVGAGASMAIIAELTKRVVREELTDPQVLLPALQQLLQELLQPVSIPLEIDNDATKPYVVLMIGVNGSGKTTTIGKLAKYFQQQGKSVMLAAGDTFRAAAVEQLQEWGKRNDVPVIAQQQGADPASVVYDALNSARAKKCDVLIADTAGRLHTQNNLMEELKKIKRVIAKFDDCAPHEVMLVLDAGVGQNALAQAEKFQQAVTVTGITLTKFDGTGKGGIIFAIAKKLQLPIRFIGVGEQLDDLRPFDAKSFVEALFDDY